MRNAVPSWWIDGVAFLGTVEYRIEDLRVCWLQFLIADSDAAMVFCAGDAE